MKIIWFALLLSNLMLVFVASTILRPGEAPAEIGFLRVIFGMIALINATLAFVLPKIFLRIQSKRMPIDPSGPLEKIVVQVGTGLVIRLALLESVTLMGFVLATVSHNLPSMFPFAGFAIFGVLANYPTESKVRDLARL